MPHQGAGEEHSPEPTVVPLPDLIGLLDSIPERYRAALLVATFASLRFGELAASENRDNAMVMDDSRRIPDGWSGYVGVDVSRHAVALELLLGESLTVVPVQRRRVSGDGVAVPRRDRGRRALVEDQREPLRGPREAIGAVEVPDGTAVSLNAGHHLPEEPVDLEFIRGLPADSTCELSLGDVVPASFAAVTQLAPGLRGLGLYIDNFGDDAPSVIAELTGLESLRLFGNSIPEDGTSLRLDDNTLSAIGDLPGLEYFALLGGSYTEHGLQQLRRLAKLRHLHIEREGLTPAMFRFAADMPALARLAGLDEFGDDGPMDPAEVQQLHAMLPHISMD